MDTATETVLVRRAREGSDAAFSRLVADNQQAVRAFLRRLCASPADADDIAQEAFVATWANLHRLREGTAFRTFVCGIAWRKAANDRRRLSRQGARDGQWTELQPQTVSPGDDARLSVQAALQTLPVDMRAAVSLCVAGDYSHSEAADILGLPLGTIKSHILKGRERLSSLLGVPS
ncbi:MAG: RNA polymerase sigma factor [Asticcacaulis sp.]